MEAADRSWNPTIYHLKWVRLQGNNSHTTEEAQFLLFYAVIFFQSFTTSVQPCAKPTTKTLILSQDIIIYYEMWILKVQNF